MKSLLEKILGIDSYLNAPSKNASPPHQVAAFGKRLDTVVLDISGSMDTIDYKPTRLKGAIKATLSFIEEVRFVPGDNIISVISFGSEANLVCPPISVNNGVQTLIQAVSDLTTDGCTNTAAGLQLADQIAASCCGAVNPRVLLLTDGHSNEGKSPLKAAQSLKSHKVQLDIIGIGGSPDDVNESELKQMASVVDGEVRYWFIRSVPELVQKFQTLALRAVR